MPPDRSLRCNPFGVSPSSLYDHMIDVLAILHYSCVSRNEWISNLRCWHIVCSIPWRRNVWISSFRYQTCQVVAVFGRHLHSSCSFRHIVWQVATIHWPSLVSCFSRNRLNLKHIACPVSSRHHPSQRNLSPTAKDILVSTLISGHYHLTLLTMFSCTSRWLSLF